MRERLRIRRAEPADAARLASFATEAFRDAYRGLDEPADIEAYVGEHFLPELMEAVISTPGTTTLLGEAGSHLAGYAILRREAAPDCVTGPDPLQLWRLYLGKAFIGQGYGADFMLAVHAEARRQGARTLWLGVYDRNIRAVAFYERFGMRKVGSRAFLFAGKSYTDPVYAGPVLDEMATVHG